jgi:hypothetical protein
MSAVSSTFERTYACGSEERATSQSSARAASSGENTYYAAFRKPAHCHLRRFHEQKTKQRFVCLLICPSRRRRVSKRQSAPRAVPSICFSGAI